MRRRGYIGSWRNVRYGSEDQTNYGNAGDNPGIPPGQVGGDNAELRQFLVQQRFTGYTPQTGKLVEVGFASPVLTSNEGENYRFFQVMKAFTRLIYDDEGDIIDEIITRIECHSGIAMCDVGGRFMETVGNGQSRFEPEIGISGRRYQGRILFWDQYNDELDERWARYSERTPSVNGQAMLYITGDEAENMLTATKSWNYELTGTFQTMRVLYSDGMYADQPILFWYENASASDIVNRAMELSDYKYWYGGSGEIANLPLANSLQKRYPGVWTKKYYDLAITFIDGVTRVGDCSFLVCYAYQIPRTNTTSLSTMFPKWTGEPRDGMILWKPGHAAIYSAGGIIELKGLEYGFVVSPVSEISEYRAVLYDPNRNY